MPQKAAQELKLCHKTWKKSAIGNYITSKMPYWSFSQNKITQISLSHGWYICIDSRLLYLLLEHSSVKIRLFLFTLCPLFSSGLFVCVFLCVRQLRGKKSIKIDMQGCVCEKEEKDLLNPFFLSLSHHTHSRRERERARVVFRRLWFRTVDFCVVTHSLTLRVKWFFSFKKRENIKKRRRGRKQVWASNWEFRVGRRDTYRHYIGVNQYWKSSSYILSEIE